MTQLASSGVILGIQLAFFEVMWPIKGIARIGYRTMSDAIDIRIEATGQLSINERQECEQQLAEIFAVVAEEAPVRLGTVSYATTADDWQGFDDLMSPDISEAIAARHAPWRLSSRSED